MDECQDSVKGVEQGAMQGASQNLPTDHLFQIPKQPQGNAIARANVYVV